ncbi:MAG: DUF1565 domain-containing protein [Trueperaceae bacterium]|nr:DUF1565 domain-containing protein [Trueperaceae bacterium]
MSLNRFQLILSLSFLSLLFGCQTQSFPPSITESRPPQIQTDLEPSLPQVPKEASLFVSTAGNDKNNGRSADQAFRTIARAISAAKAGDVVFIGGGRYMEQTLYFERSGSKQAPITFMSSPGERAIIDWSGSKGGQDQQALKFSRVSHIVMRDITVKNGPQQCVLVHNGSSHNTFINMVFDGCWGSGFQIFDGSYNVVAYSVARNNYGGGNSDGFGSIGQGGESIGNEFWFNLAENNADDGFDSWKGQNTLFYGNIARGNGYNGGDGNGFKLGSSGHDVKNIVRRNIAYQNKRSGFDNNIGGGNLIENNTAWNNGRHNFESSKAVSKNTWRNNLSLGSSVGMFDDTIEEKNSWNLHLTNPKIASYDPGSSNFLSLAKNSPAIDRGKNIGLPFIGVAPDLGALELGASLYSLKFLK